MTVKPLASYFFCSASSCAYCGVFPHLRGDVDEQQRLALVGGERGRLALERLDRGVPHRCELLGDGDRGRRGAGGGRLAGRRLRPSGSRPWAGAGCGLRVFEQLAASRPASRAIDGEPSHGADATQRVPLARSLLYVRLAMRHLYADFIDRVAKPARYLGGEYQAVVKEPDVEARVCLAFPDVYDIGMSHLGTKIIYSLLNKDPRIACERAFAPWTRHGGRAARARPAARVAREPAPAARVRRHRHLAAVRADVHQRPHAARPRRHPAARGGSRAEDATLVLVGGPTASHPEPMAPFIDAAFIGEAEELLPALVLAWAALRTRDPRRRAHARATRSPSSRRGSRSTCRRCTRPRSTPTTGMTVVGAPLDPRVPARVARAMVARPRRVSVPDRHAGAVRRGRVRARVGRDRARLHRGLPVLPGRHDLPAGARALAAVDRGLADRRRRQAPATTRPG